MLPLALISVHVAKARYALLERRLDDLALAHSRVESLNEFAHGGLMSELLSRVYQTWRRVCLDFVGVELLVALLDRIQQRCARVSTDMICEGLVQVYLA